MKNKFSSVIFLLVVIIVFINLLQFLWLIHSYRTTKKQYQEIVNESLRSASLDYTQLKVAAYEEFLKKNTEVIVVPPTKKNEEEKLTIKIKSPAQESFTATIKTLPVEYRRLYNSENRNPYAFNKPVFDSIFKNKLQKKGIKASFIVDTFHLKNSFEVEQNLHAHKNYPVQTDAIPLNVFSKIAVYSSVKNYPQYILKNIFFLLVLSVLAILAANLFLFSILKKVTSEKRSRAIRDDFISNMTHEIKTPIAVITSAIDTLLYHTGLDNKEKVMKYLQISKREAEHLNRMVDKLMDTAIDKEPEIKLQNHVDIPELINTIIDKYRLLYGSGININYIPAANKKKVLMDQLHFANAVNNIIENAVKYGNEPIIINISSSVTDAECIITITDNGPGIDSKYHGVVFEKFFRVPDSSFKQGYGLGLYYTKKVIGAHNGKIELESTLGAGAKFTIKIPVAS